MVSKKSTKRVKKEFTAELNTKVDTLPLNEVKEEIKVEAVKEEIKKKYLKCQFCDTKEYEVSAQDPSSFWCKRCGRCNQVIWYE